MLTEPIGSGRITYARRRLLKLIEQRKLRRFCEDNGLNHCTYFKLAYGKQAVTYKVMSDSCAVIPVIEWLFYTDENLPYEPVLIPRWKCGWGRSLFVRKHSEEYMAIAEKYGLSTTVMMNVLAMKRTYPSPEFIRMLCDQENPIVFFVENEDDVKMMRQGNVPERGDIIISDGQLFFVVARRKKKTNQFFLSPVRSSEYTDGTELEDTKTKGVVRPEIVIMDWDNDKMREQLFVERCNEKITKKVMAMFRMLVR